MNTNFFAPRLALRVGVLLFTAGLAGCGTQEPVAARVDPEQARETLQKVLETWQSGGTPETCQAASPKIIVQDFDWVAGSKLRNFEILGPGEAQDANLVCPVKLTLVDPAQGEKQRTVKYVVGTDPVLTVFRGME